MAENTIFYFPMQIAENGIISFTSVFGDRVPRILPSSVTYVRQTYILVPFWADIDIALGGSITYEIYSRDVSSSIALLNFISAFIEAREGVIFSGCWMLIVTWSDTRPHSTFDSASGVSALGAQ